MAERARTAGLLLVCLLAAAAVWFMAAGTLDTKGFLPASGDAGTEAQRVRGGPELAATGRRQLEQADRAEAGLGGRVLRDGAPVAAEVAIYRLTSVPWGGSAAGRDPARWHNSARPVPPMDPVALTRSGVDGRFDVDDLPGGHYRIVASDGERHGTCRHLFLAGDGRRVEVDIRLVPGGGTLRGTVRFEDGTPWRGRVQATPSWDRRWFEGPLPGDPPGTRTDAQGAYELRGLPYGPLRVQAIDAHGVRILAPRAWVPHEQRVDLVVRAHDTWMDLTVVAGGSGRVIPYATVLATGYSRHPAPDLFLATKTDAEGCARVPAGNDDVWLRVEAEGWAKADTTFPVGTKHGYVTLARVATVRGRVVDVATKAPIPALSVSLGTGCFALTDADGRFELHDAPAGFGTLGCEGQGWLPRSLAGREDGGWPVVVQAGSTTTVALEAARGVRARGTVLGPGDRPVPGASVTAHRWQDNESQEAVLGTAVADENGAFEITGLAGETEHVFRAEAPGYALAISGAWTGKPGGEGDVAVLRLRPPRRIDVRVTDEGGRPLPGVRVALKGREALWTYVMTGDDGWARIAGMSREALKLWARCGGRAVYQQDVEAAPDDGGGPETIEVVLGDAGEITGHLVWRDGSPAVGIDVHLAPVDKTDETDVDGAFRFTFVPEDACTLTATVERDALKFEATADVTPGTHDVELRLDAPPPTVAPKVEIVVLDGAGVPVASAVVERFENEDRGEWSVRAGRVEVPGGWSALKIGGALSSAGAPLPLGTLSLPAHDGTSTQLSVTLPPEAVIEGVVLTEAGEPLGGTRVTPKDGRTLPADALGHFRLGGLGEEEVSIEFDPPGTYLRHSEILRGGDRAVEIRVRRAAPVLVRVVDPRGEPVPSARVAWERIGAQGVTVLDPSGNLETDRRGEARPPRLDPAARYRLTASPTEDETELIATLIDDWTPADTTLRLRQGLSVEGVVVDARGRPIEHADVLGHQQGEQQTAETDAQGRFRLQRLEPGPVRVGASLANQWGGWGGWDLTQSVVREIETEVVQVAAGTTGLRIELDAAPPIRVVLDGWKKGPADLEDDGPRACLGEDKGGDDAFPWSATLRADGSGAFQNPEPGVRYTIWIGELPGGRYVLESGLVGRTEPYRLTLRQGGIVRGVIHADPGVEIDHVGARIRDEWIGGVLGEHGSFEIRGLPPGSVEVEVSGTVGDDDVSASATVRVGGSVTLELRRDGN